MARRYWYYYTGIEGDETNLSQYYRVDQNPQICLNGSKLCAIYAPAGADFPSVISDNIRMYIILAKIAWIPEPQRPVGTKWFVYMRI